MLVPTQRTVNHIPLSSLILSDENMRQGKSVDKSFVESLLVNGVIQALVVCQKGDKYEVAAGRRRLNGLRKLQREKRIEKEYPVPCLICRDDEQMKTLSIAENLHRKIPHATEFYTAINDLVKQGLPKQDICNRLQIDALRYERILRLANLHSKIYKAYAKGDLNDEQARAFATTDNKKLQHRVWAESDYSLQIRPASIKRALIGEIHSQSPISLFVSEQVYLSEGGTITRDLFGDINIIHDSDLMRGLAHGKLERLTQEFHANAPDWAWVECRLPGLGIDDLEIKDRFTPKYRNKNEAQRRAETELRAKLKVLENVDVDDMTEEQDRQYDQLVESIESLHIETNRENQYYLKKEMKYSGVVISIDQKGNPEYKMGLQRRDDIAALRNSEKNKAANKAGVDTGTGDPGASSAVGHNDYSQVLRADMDRYRRAMIKADILKYPELATELLHYSIIVETLMDRYTGGKFHDLSSHKTNDDTSRDDYPDSKMANALQRAYEKLTLDWLDKDGEVEKVEAYISLTKAQKNALLAYVSAVTLQSDRERYIESEIAIDYREYFDPGYENYFSRVPKSILLEHKADITSQSVTPEDHHTTKKLLAEQLSSYFDGKGANKVWLPPLLRSIQTA